MLRTAEDMISYALEQKMADPIAFLRKAWHPEFKTAELSERAKEINAADAPMENLDFFVQFDAYIKAKSRKVSPGMLRTYHVVKQRLIDFQKHRKSKITFDSFDYNFYEALVNYLTYEHIHHRRQTILRGLKRNSIGTTVKQLRIFLRDRSRRKITPSLDLADFKIFDEQTDAIYLTMGEIRVIYDFDLTDYPELVRFRDMFVLGCLAGLRFSDYNSIRPEDIRNGMLYKKQGKSDHWVVIPLRPEAHEILVNRFNKKVPKTSNGELNRHIKKVGHLAGIDMPIKVYL